MKEVSTVQIGGNLHINLPKALRHDPVWVAAQRETGRLKRIADKLWAAKERDRSRPTPQPE